MNPAEFASLDRHHLWHPYTRFSTMAAGPLPLITRAEGIYLIDDKGHRHLDAIASWWCCTLGHGHPRIVEAIRAQAGELQHSILGNLSHPRAVELAAALAGVMPDPQRHVLFASDGASAVEAALKIALQYWHNIGKPAKKRFAYLEDGYHGDTLGAVSVGYLEGFHKPFEPILFPAHELPMPAHVEDELRCFGATELLIRKYADELAGLIVEPLCQCAAGMKMYSPPYLGRLAELCRAHDVLFIVDEIATGFGRTGRMFAFEHAELNPDIVCVGKALAAGYLPISATIVQDRLYETFADSPEDRSFYHGHTFCGNPIAAAAALAAIRVYEDEQIHERAQELERAFRAAMTPLAELPHVKEVRVLGGIAAVELKGQEDPQAAAKEHILPPALAVRDALLRQNILIRPLGNVVYLMPPLILSEAERDRLIEAFCEAVRKLS